MGVTRHSSPKKLQCCCICAFALFVALLLISCPVSADSQVDNDLVFENFDIPNNQHISRRHVPNKSSIHQDVESSQDLEDNRYLHRIKRNLIGLFDFLSPSTAEKTNEIPALQKTEDGDDLDSERANIDDIDVGGKLAQTRQTRQPIIDDDDDDIHGSGEGSGVEPDLHSGVYRFSITVHEPYIAEYADRNSNEFKKLENDLVDAVEQIYEDMPGTQTASIVEIEEIPHEHIQCRVTMDLTSADYKNKNAIKDKLLNRIEDHHRLGIITVDPKDFIFSEFEDRVHACGPEEFPCANGECIAIEFRCDKTAQCLDSSDEAGCPTSPIETTTPTTTSTSTTTTTTTTTTPAPPPIPTTTEAPSPVEPAVEPEVMLPEIDTPDETEAPTTTTTTSTTTPAVVDTPEQTPENFPVVHHQVTARPLGQCRADDTFTCTDGHQICADQQCDEITDCADGSDEEGCLTPPACAIGEFSCDLTRCIQATQRCDGIEDCDDKTDELECPAPKCHPHQFTCDDGSCIERNQQCNGQPDCPHGEDEASCSPTRCSAEEFTCGDGRCIRMEAKCDRKYDCTDNSDEKNCPCKEDDFRCSNGYCIPKSQRCDGTRNCQDESDEFDCTTTCKTNEFTCKDNGKCISEEKKCDDNDDCTDGSDEEDCENAEDCDFTCSDGECGKRCDNYIDCAEGEDETNCGKCSEYEFTCDSSDCIQESLRCNGEVDCPSDDSDERNCACKPNEFNCGDGSCIDQEFVCDSYTDCINTRKDEENCTAAACDLSVEFDCGDNRCIPQELMCNGIPDCFDKRDESSEVCKSRQVCSKTEFTCADGTCVPSHYNCDGIPQCRDGSDELNCGCRHDQFLCLNGDCIPDYLKCNGVPECNDQSDEYNCPTPLPTAAPDETPKQLKCQPGSELCRSGDECYPRSRACDGIPDCRDRSDESNCDRGAPGPPPVLNLKTYPSSQAIKESSFKVGREVVFQCRDEGTLRAAVRWSRGNNQPLPPGSKDTFGRLEIPNIQQEHSGIYICSARGFPATTPGAQVSVDLNVEPLIEQSSPHPIACALHEATCSNGACIPKNLVCNGKFDCADGSDETRCSMHGCEPNEFRCANKRCVLKTWVCDSDDDCGDGSDEISCGTIPPGAQCSNKQFRCHSGDQCIPKSFHCDSENDCVDKSDEYGCSAVTILRPPPPMIELAATNIFEITCTAVGVPIPEIVWRLNWGHIPEKCKTTSVNGTGVLTCPDIQEEDSGAYSCEAINIRGSVFAIPDTILVVKREPVVCPRGSFNDEAKSANDCIRCFCFGVTDRCRSADLYTYQIAPPFDSHRIIGVNVNPTTGTVDIRESASFTERSPLRVTPTRSRFGVETYLAQTDPGSTTIPYFVMPENYNSNQLKTYGGYLKYNVQHRGRGRPLSQAPDVIITGNGYTLLHVGKPLQDGQTEHVTVRFFVGDWVKKTVNGDDIPATREEIMMALASVDNILIKLQYIEGSIDTTLDGVEMDSAGARNTGLGLAVYVEECSCPVGYSGYSCESCAPGYVRHHSGPWLGQCYKEERCPHGTYGDPSRGIPCTECPCPHTSAPNQFTQTCSLGPSGDVICNCPVGYRGNRCEECDRGYTGNPVQHGDYCKPVQDTCDSRGSESSERDAYGQCPCKQLTTGRDCNECQANTFHLSNDNLFGCIACFCMGVTKTCKSSDYYRDTVSTTFGNSINDFKIVDLESLDSPTDQGITADPRNREIVYSNFSSRSPDVKYWSLPSRFLGDKITAYGGNLKYTLRYKPTPGGSSSKNTAPDVELISKNHIRLSHYRRVQTEPNIAQTISVPLLEQDWQRNDGQKPDREHLLMALADIQSIIIKATYTTNSQEVALSSVALDIAENRFMGNPARALEVEQCDCPPGYVGLSCQDCDYGFKRASHGLYLGLCEKCECNGFSEECDAETGYCFNCREHRTGSYCDQCAQGYVKNDLNQCVRSEEGGVDCLCDPRGSIATTCYGGYCRCKANVVGQTCNRCREGTFGLSENLTEGCQSCFCSGVATDCTESNLYIEQIPSEIYSDGHNFTLTDQAMRNKITGGFQTNSARNEIGHQFRPSQNERLFWSLPIRFTGNRITSYGGKLEFTQRYTQRPNAKYTLDQDVIISGNGITIYWTNDNHQQPEIVNRISVILSPIANWQRQDPRQGPRPASREDIMRVLANIDSVLIRAQLSSDTASSFISDITLDTAVSQHTSIRANNVEVCRCPPGYRGSSCELCESGHYRDLNDIQVGPLGSCITCPCNNHESSCELINNRVVCHCLQGYTGYDCADLETPATPAPPPYPDPLPQHPKIFVKITEPSLQIVEAGDNVHFHCQARTLTSNAVKIYWTKDAGQLPDRAVDDHQGLLVITDVRISDSGRYICEASDGINVVSQHITLTVGGNPPERPHATIYPTQVDILEGESFDLRCDATGNPTPDINWEREDNSPFNTGHGISSGRLHIPRALVTDTGRYICRAINVAGTTLSYVDVRVTQSNQPSQPIIRPEYTSAEIGGTFTISCETNEDYSSIRWEKEGGYYNPISDNGILTINNARPDDSGIYVCIITVRTGQTSRKSATVSVASPEERQHPIVHISPKNQTAGEGSTIELVCEVSGSPTPIVKWTRAHDKFGSDTQQIGNILRIAGVKMSDRGIYVCIASNDHGIAQSSSILEVERRETPQVEIYPIGTQTANEGSNVQVYCRVTGGIPTPTLTWTRRDGRPMNQFYPGSDLRFNRISIADAGEYTCTATNDVGLATATTTLVVIIPPQITLSHTGTVTIRENEYIRIECRATGQPTPSVQWTKHAYAGGQDVGPAIGDATLEIHKAATSDQGTYICQARNGGGTREEAIQLIVDSYPHRGDITGEDSGSDRDPYYPTRPDTKHNEHAPNVLHESLSAPAGTTAELRCRVSGQSERYPIHTEWIRKNNISLPRGSQRYGSSLHINNVQPEDGGDYVCLGRDSTSGSVRFTVTVNLVVQAVPRILLEPPRQVVRPYENAVILCKATGDQPIDIQWHAMGREMPPSVHADRGVLEFRGIQLSDAGRYRCRASNRAGVADSVAEVLVDANNQPHIPVIPELSITPTAYDVKYGDHLDLQCRSNEPGVILTWSKVNDRFSDNVANYAGLLRFTSLTTENNGVYRCETKGPSGIYHRDYTIDIIDTVQEATAPPPVNIEYAPQGESIYMECKTDLDEPVTYEWSKQNGEFPQDVDAFKKQLRINDLTSEDAGTYVCSASNGGQSVDTPTVLVVKGIVPYFSQAPNSYLALQTIPEHYARLNFEISFKPESDYGLILFSGNSKRKDFISLAITGGFIEFKFNLGHDTTTTLVSEEPVQIGKWHTVKVRRDRKTGIMYVDGKGPVVETSKGRYSGLTLTDPLYLGGAPDYNNIPEDIDIKSGFVGCISQLKVGHQYYDLIREASVKVGITTCETCQESPCQHQGVCQESLSKEGYTCICTEGYSGPTCNKIASQSCTPYVCGIGRCVDNEYSYECHCPIGRTGSRCEREISVYEPAFTKNAYVAYPPLKSPRRLRISLKVKPNDLEDGILMYSAQDPEGHGNFASLAIKDRRVEFRYDVGNGPIVIRSDKEVQAGEYITISAVKSVSEGRLMVSGGNMIVEKPIGAASSLTLNTPLFLGGVNQAEITVNPGVGVGGGFNGCIADFSIVGVDLQLIESATGSSNIMDCSSLNNDHNDISNDVLHAHDNSRTGCSNNPCWNDGQCYPLSPIDYKCSCVNGYSGRDCELPPNQCDQLRPCQNGGTCEGTTIGYQCSCPVHYQGTNCEQRQQIGNEAHFEGNGYLEFDRNLLNHDNPEQEEVIALQFSSNSSNGLMFWQGQPPNEDGRDKDYIALAVENGYLLFSFNSGSGPVDILNDGIKVDDGKLHTVILKRRGNYGSIEVDNEHLKKGEGLYRRKINCEGNIYLGGTPNISLMTGRFSQGFSGCVHGLEVQNYPSIDLGARAISGINVKPCSSEYDEEIVN